MSQVIVEDDIYKERRLRSRGQEEKIAKNAQYTKWQKTGTQGLSLILKGAKVAALPVIAFWTVLLAGVGFAVGLVATLMRFLGSFFKRN